jgi:branched-chain amino acid transport system permease protein
MATTSLAAVLDADKHAARDAVPGARWRWAPWIVLALLVALPWLCAATGQEYYLGFARRVLIMALAAGSLNFIMGYGGLVALGHAGFIGVGAYTLVALSEAGVTSAWALWGAAAVGAAAVAAATGAIALRTRGVYFIMITLAFAQMLYYLAVSLRVFGGDDGYNLAARPALGLGLSLDDDATFYWVVLAIAAAGFAGFNLLLQSRFGQALRGTRDNESRMTALGYPVYRIRLIAFTLTGAVAGLAGALLIVHNGFVTPGSMQWSQSAILVVMVVLGGLGRPWGAAVGVLVWMGLEETLRQFTAYWHWPVGLLLIAIVLLAPRGLCALFDRRPT